MIYKFSLKKILFFTFLLIFLILNKSHSSNQIIILVKIDNEIVTNIDVEKEYRYLLALNEDLKTIDKNKVMKLAKNSVVKEKIKKIEVLKYFNFEQENSYLNNIFRDFYLSLNINNENDFKKYLSKYNLTVDDIKEKLKIESFWNELIFSKYRNQVEIDEEKLRRKINQKKNKKNSQNNYLIFEIMFNASSKENLNKKYEEINESISKIGFQNTANIFSSSDSSKKGGKVGWVNENQLSDSIKKELKKINVGEHTNIISVPGGALILKIENTKKIEKVLDVETELKKAVSFEKNRQLNQFSSIYFNKVKYSLNIYEK